MTFFFRPTAEELKTLSQTLNKLKLKTVAFGTYFNLFRPDDTGFMGSSRQTMKLVAAHAELFGCKQFVTWSASYSSQFGGADPRNHTPEAVARLHRAIREVLLPIIEPIGGRVAFEPYFPHVVGTLELAKEVARPLSRRPDRLAAGPAQLHFARPLSPSRRGVASHVPRAGRSHPDGPPQGHEA